MVIRWSTVVSSLVCVTFFGRLGLAQESKESRIIGNLRALVSSLKIDRSVFTFIERIPLDTRSFAVLK